MNNEIITYFIGAFVMFVFSMICSLESFSAGSVVLMWIGIASLLKE